MPQRDWYRQSIIFLVLLFLTCSALGIAYNDIVRMPPVDDPAALSARYCLTFPVSYPSTEVRDAEAWRPVILLENLGLHEATIEIMVYDANGTELPGAIADGRPISVPAGGSAAFPLADAARLPAGQYSISLSSNQPITGTFEPQAAAGEIENSDL